MADKVNPTQEPVLAKSFRIPTDLFKDFVGEARIVLGNPAGIYVLPPLDKLDANRLARLQKDYHLIAIPKEGLSK